MATQEKTWNVANRLHSLKDSDNPEVNHIIAGADEIYDDAKGAKQSDINAQNDAAFADRYTKAETYSKEQLDSLITTPDVNYVTVATFADLPQTGEPDTVYRVSSYDGTQVDASKYALYAWNGTSYQMLAVRSAVGEVFDVSEYNSGATYETLTAALAAVPASVQRGGMSIKFILRTNTGTEEEPVYHDEYVQYRLMSTDWSTVITDWQGVDKVPTPDSDNLVRSGGVQNELALGAVYDVSAKNPTAGPNNDGKFESLSALLSDNNLNILIPTAVRKGGMSIKFVHSSDNKYVQYRLMLSTFTAAQFTNTANWQGVDDEPTAGSSNLVKSGGVFLLGEEEKAASFNSILRDFEVIGVTADMLSELIWNGSTVQKSQSAYRSIIIKIDPTATYTWNINHAVLGFVSIPKIGDSPQVIGQSLKELVNVEDYQYVMINLVSEGENFSYSKNVIKTIKDTYSLDETSDLFGTEFIKTDVLVNATILGGYYNALGQFVGNNDFSSFEISVDNSIDLNKVFVYYNLKWDSTATVPSVLFFNGTTLISKYEDLQGKHCRVIPAGTTRIAFNLGNSYTAQRGDKFFIVSTNVLQHVAGAISDLKVKNQSQDEAFVALQESVDEDIAEMQESISQFDYYSDYIDLDKTTTQNRISVYVDEAKDIKSSQYEIKIDFEHPNGLTAYQLFKATTAHGGLESIGSSFEVGKTYTITKDPAKPVLYIYGATTNTTVNEYNVDVLMYVVNKEGVAYKNSLLYGNSLANKKIVVFGDSLSEYKDSDGKTWTQHAQEMTNADITNVAIGGTQLRQRVAIVTVFKDDVSYAVGDRVFYKPSTKMNCYECINAHSAGAWNASDFEEVSYTNHTYPYATLDIINMVAACCDTTTPIEDRFENQIAAAQCIADHYPSDTNNPPIVARLTAIDWSKIDAVVILAGTNDYGENNNHGQSSSTDVNKTMGAINEIVRLLCTTYKHLSLYYVSPTVHWRDYSQGVGDPNKWCDVYMPAGEQITRGQFYDNIISEFVLNHIPTLNLYKELGWNKYNFSDYFWQDGTHPSKGKGFFMMANKIVGFLAANKAF